MTSGSSTTTLARLCPRPAWSNWAPSPAGYPRSPQPETDSPSRSNGPDLFVWILPAASPGHSSTRGQSRAAFRVTALASDQQVAEARFRRGRTQLDVSNPPAAELESGRMRIRPSFLLSDQFSDYRPLIGPRQPLAHGRPLRSPHAAAACRAWLGTKRSPSQTPHACHVVHAGCFWFDPARTRADCQAVRTAVASISTSASRESLRPSLVTPTIVVAGWCSPKTST